MQADFMNMPIPDATFDAAYAIEATCHAPDAVCLAHLFSCIISLLISFQKKKNLKRDTIPHSTSNLDRILFKFVIRITSPA